MTPQHCKCCQATTIQLQYPQVQDYITNDRFDLWHCSTCGVHFIDFQGDLSKYYPARYRRYSQPILALLRQLYRFRVSRWAQEFASPGLAYELGCGDGFMLEALRNKGWNTIGSERTESVLYYARNELGLTVFVGESDALQPAPTFDLIVLFQVLEHMTDPMRTLAQLSKLLKPNGRLIIGVPNNSSWQAKWAGAKWFHLDPPRHLFHFSPDSLSYCLNQSGMQIIKTRYFSPEHDPFGWVQSILNRIDSRPNRLTRLLSGMDKPDAVNLLHLIVGCILGVLAVPVSLVSWVFGRGAIIEIVAGRSS